MLEKINDLSSFCFPPLEIPREYLEGTPTGITGKKKMMQGIPENKTK
jgi:hypothetical protein